MNCATGSIKVKYHYEESVLAKYISSTAEQYSKTWIYNQKIIFNYSQFGQLESEQIYWWNRNVLDWNDSFQLKDYYYTIIKGTQVITFRDIQEAYPGISTLELQATSSAELPITYTSSDESVATIDGNEITVLALGTATITASQEGNGEYEAAESVSRTLNVVVTDVDDQGVTEASDLLILPNPVVDAFTFSKDFGKANQVVIYNTQGKAVKTFNKPQDAYNVSELRTGLYSMIIQTDAKLFSKKLLKK